jgi:hypothetical protein
MQQRTQISPSKIGRFRRDRIDDLLLAMSPLKELILGVGLLGEAFGVLDEKLGLFLGEFHEVLPSDPQDVVDEPVEGSGVGDWQIALEDHAIETREHRHDQAGKLDDEARQRLHGVLLRGVGSGNPILEGGRRLCSSFLVAAWPR